jgi:hypothetical protein
MAGKIIITASGYDPQVGKHVKDPYLGPNPSLGACRPDVRERLKEGDHLFFISGKLRNFNQFVMGGFQVGEKIDAMTAYERFPQQRLHLREDDQLGGNVIVDANGAQHPLDHHKQESFARRIKNYIVGTNEICMETPEEIAIAREQTLEMLRELFSRQDGKSPWDIVGHWGSDLTDEQIFRLREWLQSLKTRT